MKQADTMPLTAIAVGSRFRRDPGDLEGLSRSIADVGLLQPVVVARDGQLIAGARRLEACRRLGWTQIPVRVLPLEDLLRGEHDENVCRKDFTVTEKVAIAKALEPVELAPAQERHTAQARRNPNRLINGRHKRG